MHGGVRVMPGTLRPCLLVRNLLRTMCRLILVARNVLLLGVLLACIPDQIAEIARILAIVMRRAGLLALAAMMGCLDGRETKGGEVDHFQ
jgi:hypothetical protein